MTSAAFPVSAVIPTRNRQEALERTLTSLATLGEFPAQLIVIDGSDDGRSREVVMRAATALGGKVEVTWRQAEALGAAIQRNQAVVLATQPFIWFFDDDIRFEPGCLSRLVAAMEGNPRLGGVNAMITNQQYHAPGSWSRLMFALMNGATSASYAGKVLGPAINLLPADDPSLPEVVPVEWLNTTCTLYRREALPSPPFDAVFTGYSLMEDLTLSLRVGRSWGLANARTARIYHDSQPGAHKSDPAALSCMELINRHYVMTRVLERRRLRDFARLWIWECYQVALSARSAGVGRAFWQQLRGKLRGLRSLIQPRAAG